MLAIAKTRVKVASKVYEEGEEVIFDDLRSFLKVHTLFRLKEKKKYREFWDKASIVRKTHRGLYRMPKEKLIRQAESQLGILARDGRGMTKVQLVNEIRKRREWLIALTTT